MKNALVFVGIGAIVIAAGWWFLAQKDTLVVKNTPQESESSQQETTDTSKPVIEGQGAVIGDENLVEFKCTGGKTITAVFERDIVGLTLSDGRQVTLRQAQSGSGIRYLSNDQKVEFIGKGNEGTLAEDGTTTYANCEAG